MDFNSMFEKENSQKVIDRINQLTHESQPSWGKMDVATMLAHCNVTYELIYTDKHPKPKGIAKFIVKTFIKGSVVGPKPYKQNSPTAPAFKISDKRVFDTEKERLVEHINKTQELGESHFEGKSSHSFGPLTANEWNNMFYKHLDHHLKQFSV